MSFAEIISAIDDFVWGPVMLILLVGTGVFLTVRLKFRPWRNLGYALKSTLSKEARTTSRGEGDVSPFSALTTALAATIGTGNIVGVATAMVAGGPGALVWMWISACFGLTSKFSECMLAIKYREVNEKGEMSGGPMYTMKKGFKNKKLGAFLGMLFAVFAVIASFGIGNMTQANSIAESVHDTFGVSTTIVGVILTILALVIIVGGIKTISKVSSVVVPFMAIFYVIAGLIVIILNIQNVPAGVAMIFKMAFSFNAVGGGLCGAITAAMMNRQDRAKQFAPFDALNGLREALAKKEYDLGKVERGDHSEELDSEISEKLSKVQRGDRISLTCYEDGYYVKVIGAVKEINTIFKYIVIGNGKVYFDDIYGIDRDLV